MILWPLYGSRTTSVAANSKILFQQSKTAQSHGQAAMDSTKRRDDSHLPRQMLADHRPSDREPKSRATAGTRYRRTKLSAEHTRDSEGCRGLLPPRRLRRAQPRGE